MWLPASVASFRADDNVLKLVMVAQLGEYTKISPNEGCTLNTIMNEPYGSTP